jgi:hypothetical protein
VSLLNVASCERFVLRERSKARVNTDGEDHKFDLYIIFASLLRTLLTTETHNILLITESQFISE